ncbi:hypothetical protein Ga0100231_011065 [Opitutaceae bacterium TAV4]|nr:hypothetical protein Ga0100231_011065 [Opitutaceae bacterium TAV4]RRJ99029.1 hypothetical protein Ga0100230_012235 [Opitutaceae bacterium TAV3]
MNQPTHPHHQASGKSNPRFLPLLLLWLLFPILLSATSDGTITTTDYNANGKPSKTTDTAGRVTETEYDASGNVTQVTYRPAPGSSELATDPEGKTTRYIYDEAGRLEAVIDPAQQATTYAYDELGRQIALAYDADGRRTGPARSCKTPQTSPNGGKRIPTTDTDASPRNALPQVISTTSTTQQATSPSWPPVATV